MKENNVRRKQRFSIRKFNVGAASVLVGVGLYFGAANVMAEEVDTEPTVVEEASNEASDASSEDAADEDAGISLMGLGDSDTSTDPEESSDTLQENPIVSGDVKDEDGNVVGSYDKYTKSDVEADLSEADSLSITDREIPQTVQDGNTVNSDGYQKDQESGHITFGIQNLEDLNQVLEANGVTQRYYVTFAMTTDDRKVYAKLVDKTTNTVVETKVLNVGDENITFSTLEQYIGLVQYNQRRLDEYDADDYAHRAIFDGTLTVNTTFMMSYTSSTQDDGTVLYYIHGDWTNAGSNQYYSNYVFSVTGGETTDA